MADHYHDDEHVSSGFNATLGVILAILLVLALLVGGWWLFFRGDTTDDTIIDQDIELEDSGETTSSP